MEKEIEEMIKKNLPAQVGDTLKKRLEKADKDEQIIIMLNDTIANHVKTISTLQEKGRIMEVKIKTDEDLTGREAAVSKRERDARVIELEYMLKASDMRAGEMAGFVGMVFKSPIFRRTVNQYDSHQDFYSGNVQQKVKSGHRLEEKVAEDSRHEED